jgi:hypothetical protein
LLQNIITLFEPIEQAACILDKMACISDLESRTFRRLQTNVVSLAPEKRMAHEMSDSPATSPSPTRVPLLFFRQQPPSVERQFAPLPEVEGPTFSYTPNLEVRSRAPSRRHLEVTPHR